MLLEKVAEKASEKSFKKMMERVEKILDEKIEGKLRKLLEDDEARFKRLQCDVETRLNSVDGSTCGRSEASAGDASTAAPSRITMATSAVAVGQMADKCIVQLLNFGAAEERGSAKRGDEGAGRDAWIPGEAADVVPADRQPRQGEVRDC